MWTKPLQFGGVVGGNQFFEGGSYPEGAALGVQYFEGSSYAPRFYNPIIINGYIFYTEVASFTGSPIFGGGSGPTDCIDLRTGELLWSRWDVPQLSFGYIFNLYDPDQHGVYPPILFTNNFAQAFDAYTGQALFNVTGVPSGTTVMGPNGEQLRYVLTNLGTTTNPNWHLQQWNSSKLWLYDINPYTGGGSLSPSVINASNGALIQQMPIPITGELASLPYGSIFVPYGSSITVNGNIGIEEGLRQSGANPTTTYDWNISLPFANSMPITPGGFSLFGPIPASAFTVIAANYNDIMLCRNGSLPSGFAATGSGTSQGPYTYFAINLNSSKGAKGSVLWWKTYNPPAGNITVNPQPVDFQTRVFTFSYGETLQWVGYSLDSGNMLWGPTTPQKSFDYYGYPGTVSLPGVIAYGNLYCSSFSGILYCYNDLTGKILWTYGNGGEGNSTYGGLAVFYGDYPTQIQSIANGVVYTATNEHTMPNPFYKGCTYRAINATDGTEIWQLSGYPSEWSTPGSAWATADGFIACMNGLDNNIYSIGRGPSATTVQAPLTQITAGNNVVIQGTVMDISAGTQQTTQKADFPNGVPCASDTSMKDWMGYVYQQKPFPTNATGVEVTLDAVDPNGNWIHIGTVTSDMSGTFGYAWKTPDVPGKYTVIATFAGTNSYWPSYTETTMVISEAPPATPTPPAAQPLPPIETYFIVATVAIIIAIAIVGILILRKRP
jgi:outer membrane protein assembly factor BamB